MFVPRPGDINVRIKNRFLRVIGEGECLSERITDLTFTNERDTSFHADSIGCGVIDRVLHGPSIDCEVGR